MQHNQMPQRIVPGILDIISAVSLFFICCLYACMLFASGYKGHEINLDFGWNLAIALYFSFLFLVRYFFLPKDEKGNISVLTAGSALIAIVFWTAVF